MYSLLAGTASIAALVGTRISPLVLPESPTLPAITYRTVGGSSKPTFTTAGQQRVRMEFNCWGAAALDAFNLRATLVAALNGYTGTLSDGTNLQNAQRLQNVDYFDHDARIYRAMVEFYLFFD